MPAKLVNAVVLMLATGFGSGYLPWAPGTFGSIWGVVLVWGMQSAHLMGPKWAMASLFIILAGVPLCSHAARLMRRKDPGAVVWDEIAAFPLVFALVPVTATTAVLGFLLFRLFDIVKPWPVRRFELLPAGWGIMADDLIAGLYAGAVLWGLMRILSS